MRYSPSIGWALMVVAVLCVLSGAPAWMFLATGLAAVGFGWIGLRQGRDERLAAEENTEETEDSDGGGPLADS